MIEEETRQATMPLLPPEPACVHTGTVDLVDPPVPKNERDGSLLHPTRVVLCLNENIEAACGGLRD